MNRCPYKAKNLILQLLSWREGSFLHCVGKMKSLLIKNKRTPFFLISCIFIALIFLLIWKFNFLNINKLDIEINNVDCVTEENIKTDINIIGKNILFFNGEDTNKKILAKYPCIKNIRWEKEFPKKINADIIGRNAFIRVARYSTPVTSALVNLEATPSSTAASLDWSLPNVSDKEFLSDETGFIFEENSIFKESTEVKLPLLFFPDRSFKITDQLDANLFTKLVAILEKFYQTGFIQPDLSAQLRFKLVDSALLVNSDQKVVLSLSKDIFRQLASLQLILQKAKIDGRAMDIIDLRFDKPIVVYGKR